MLSLGSLPVLESNTICPVICATRPNHVLWTMTDGTEVKVWFKANYLQLDLDGMISNEEWELFAGTPQRLQQFGIPTLSIQSWITGMVGTENKECGLVLMMNVKEFSYCQIVHQADLSTVGLISVFMFLLLKVIVKIGEQIHKNKIEVHRTNE